ncbi:MAG TPA: amino acid ABC transporter permease [Candidatus Babeliales bacterium]|nr:amino acid ABC transporter permease [Candidatus Babeliales bacterium]
MYDAFFSVKNALPLLIQGAAMTLFLWVAALVIAISLGTVLGILRCKRLRISTLSTFLDTITFLLRAIPFYVQLLMAYFVLPELVGVNISATTAGIFSLGICSAAYISQIIRGGINAIDVGQWQAAYVLGYTSCDTVRYVILPQVVRIIIPSLSGELDQLLKSTSIISAIGVLELTGAAKNVIARELNPLTMYIVISVVYVMIAFVFNSLTSCVERKLSYD